MKKSTTHEKSHLKFSHPIRVRFNEVDSLNIVWHGHYVKYFEEGREAFGRVFGLTYLDAKTHGYATPIVKTVLEHQSPLRYGEVATIETTYLNSRAAKLMFAYRITNEKGDTVCTGETTQVFTNFNTSDMALNLPEFYKKHGLEVVSSLPFYTKDRTDRQRGNGVFEDSIKALKMLNDVGYGVDGSDLVLNLVYNPAGAFLPPSQEALEREFKQSLFKDFGISFNNLFAITNLPISRYLDYLINSGNYERYMEKLIAAFNPAAAMKVMCRNTISVGWDGEMYDCDFNQMLELKTDTAHQHISSFNIKELNTRNIVINQHCYGCTAGAGSSCGGAVT